MLNKLTLIILTLIFTGCTKVVYKPVYKTKYVYIKPPQYLIKDTIKTPEPPKRHIFIKAGPIERETRLTLYIIDLLNVIKKYKIHRKELLKWYNKTHQSGE